MPIKTETPQDDPEEHLSKEEKQLGRPINHQLIYQLYEEKKKLDRIQWCLSIFSCIFLCLPGFVSIIVGIIVVSKYKIGGSITIGVGFIVILSSILCCCAIAVIRRTIKGDAKFYLFLAGEQRLRREEE